MGTIIIVVLFIGLIVWLLPIVMPIILSVGLPILGIYLLYLIYQAIYFKSKKFLAIKDEIKSYTDECNELNAHIEDLKKAYIGVKSVDYGVANYTDNSKYNFKRPELKKVKQETNTYECSLSVCKNAQQQPFKYICKYFNIEANEETLDRFEKVFNDFSAAEQGKILLKNKKEEILKNISSKIPFLIRTISKKTLARKLGFEDIDFSDLHFPKYSFKYVSGGGNSSMTCDVVFDLNNLEKFIEYLSGVIKFKKSVAGQRALMTAKLRESIKTRDNYTCQKCGVSTDDEPHLLLEIDHIIPLAKNGLTTEDNLQTLCWKCNRTKGSKIE